MKPKELCTKRYEELFGEPEAFLKHLAIKFIKFINDKYVFIKFSAHRSCKQSGA